MDVITERIIYSYGDGTPNLVEPNKPFLTKGSETNTKKGLKGIFQKKPQPLMHDMEAISKQMEGMNQTQITEILKTLTKPEIAELNKIQRARIKGERKDARKVRRANRKAKKLIKLRDKQGKIIHFYPLTKLKRKNNKIVKPEPDGTETIINTQDVVVDKRGNLLDKNEVSNATGIDKSKINTETVEKQKTEFSAEENPDQKNQTNTATGEKIITVKVDDKNVSTDGDGDPYLGSDIVLTDEGSPEDKALKQAKDESSKGAKGNVWMWVGLGVGVLAIGGLITYLVVSNKNSN